MPPTTALDDDAIARLLAEDAHAASKRYVSQGLSALLPKRANGGAPKPNTRFLKNLVRDADSHNAGLKRKEDQERRERLRRFAQHHEPEGRGQRDGEEGGDRKRMRLDNKREENDARDRKHREKRHSHKHSHRQRNTSSARSRSRSPDRPRQHRKQASRRDRDQSADRQTRTHTHRKHHRRRSRSTEHAATRPMLSEGQSRNTRSRREPTPTRSSSSDPLEDLVGPLPISKHDASTPKSRGRGASKQSTSAMDHHFSPTYDPALDLLPDSEDSAEKGDWDMALEAMKDRQEWKKKHADRMREAGFGDDEIRKWEDSGREKSAGDLKWRKAGEGREWDAGKEITEADETFGRLSRKADSDLMSSWKRKSGGLLKDIKSAKS